MIPQKFEIARVVIEFDTPMVVGAASTADLDDVACVQDAFGLPAIPGTSIAGALRHALAREGTGRSLTDPVCSRLFGFQRPGAERHVDSGQASRLSVSWAQVHDGRDHPVSARGVDAVADPVLRFLASGAVRDHVRLDERGVVDGTGKFDERLVPAGARFTFELLLDRTPVAAAAGLASSDDLPGIERLVALLAAAGFSLGGRTRRGLGSFHVVRWSHRSFDLTKTADRGPFQALSVDLAATVDPAVLPWQTVPAPIEPPGTRMAVLLLEPEDFYLVGDGLPFTPERDATGRYQHVDSFPYREHRIVWSKDRGAVSDEPDLVIPASGIKGALRHRVTFHANVIAGCFADLPGEDQRERAATWVEGLFGSARDDGSGTPGRVLVSECRRASFRHGILSHVSLDRFTRGPMDGALFGEAPVWGRGDPFELCVQVLQWSSLPNEARRALELALGDLCGGRLSFGAGSSRGHGYTRGELHWIEPRISAAGGEV